MNAARAAAVVIALVGVGWCAYTEYGTVRAADFVPSFGWFAFAAGPYVLAAILALLTPYGRTLCCVGVAMLALEAWAYYDVFIAPPTADAALIYLRKPFYDLAIIAAGMLAGGLLGRARGGVR